MFLYEAYVRYKMLFCQKNFKPEKTLFGYTKKKHISTI